MPSQPAGPPAPAHRKRWFASLAAALAATSLSLAPATAAFAAPPTFIQVASATPQTPESVVSVALPATETAGNTLIVAIGWNDTVASISGLTDSAGNTYATAIPTFRGSGLSQAIYYADEITAGGNTVTVTFDGPASYVDLRVTEYSGIGAFDAGASATAGTGDGDSGDVTTTNAHDLLFGAGVTGGGFSAAGAGYTSRTITLDGDIIEDRTVTTVGTYRATAPNLGPWLMQLAAFKADDSGGPSAPVAAFTGSPTSGTTPLPVQFTDASTGAPTGWAWTFGDGGTSTAQNPSHTYSAAGTYTVSLTVTNAAGSDTKTRTAYVTVGTPTTTGWPNAANTGVPAGTTLTPYTGPCIITAPHTVIDANTVDCDLVIQAADVSITRSKINGSVWLDTDYLEAPGWSVNVTDSEVDAGVIQHAVICCGNMTLLRVNAHGGVTAAQCEEKSLYCKITDSWLHGQALPDDVYWHLGGFLSDGTLGAGCSGTWCIELVHNTVVCDHPINNVNEGCTGDINLIPNFATASKVRIFNNYLGANTGSAYCTYGGERSDSPYPHADHVVYQDNVFQRGTNGLCAGYGPVTGFNTDGPGNEWLNNTWDDDGTPVTPAN